MRACLTLTAHDIDFDRSIREALFFFGLRLFNYSASHEELLNNLPQSGYIVVEQDAGGKTPSNPEHHDSHHDGHGTHRRCLLAGLIHRLVERRDERKDRKQHQRDEIREGNDDTVSPLRGWGRREIRENVVEHELGIRETLGKRPQQREERQEDGHLNKKGKAATEGIEFVLGIELLHLLCLTLGIISVALLDLHELRLENLHAGGRLGGFKKQRGKSQTDDHRQDDDRKAPIDCKALDKGKDLIENVNDPIPHVYNPPNVCCYGTGSYPPL